MKDEKQEKNVEKQCKKDKRQKQNGKKQRIRIGFYSLDKVYAYRQEKNKNRHPLTAGLKVSGGFWLFDNFSYL